MRRGVVGLRGSVIAIFTSKATSLRNVGRDIAMVSQKRGCIPQLFTYLIPGYDVYEKFDKAIYIMTFSPLWVKPWVLNAMEVYHGGKGKPVVFYTTVEGDPKPHLMKPWLYNPVPYIANSHYTKEKLEKAGLYVRDVVYHGINLDEVKIAKTEVKRARKMLESKLGSGVYFGVVSTAHPRKGLDFLFKAIDIARKQDKDIKFYVLTNGDYASRDGVLVDRSFGQHNKTDVLAFMGAVDFIVIPSFCEGFGLVLIEANAMGTPVIHCRYPPLTEITNDSNIQFDYEDIQSMDVGDGILYEYHLYKPKELAQAILEASEIAKERREEYENRAKSVEEAVEKFDATIHYNRLLDILDSTGAQSG